MAASPSHGDLCPVTSAKAQQEPVNIDNDAAYEVEDFDLIHHEDADDAEASEDADGFSAAAEDPEPELGPESALTHAVREAYMRDFAAAAESRTCFLSSSAGILRSLAGSRPEACPRKMASIVQFPFRQPLELYTDCEGVVDDYPEGTLSTWPRGALNGCPCCGDTLRCSSAVPQRQGSWKKQQQWRGRSLDWSAEVAAGSPAATEGNPVPPVPSAGAAALGTMAAAVSACAAVLGTAVLASTDWLLRDTCSPEAAGPGPTSLHSVHFDAC
ncbi:hypothetical protein VOLCADRAFT_87411 [Volvox carteri f. nagariensis]|uniref:Uncharacterized protein n=1 Tax=Volvox carteri f. nagariensis TaxID=3068 RepID=D8TLA1_VOLCA|nr:uncharacterized protein VOLCADRAFT_87411 [Volvox carteri f. nagariensis]EFJ51837.1 hypothetical protein VOLCADRAFT_87411 [Volvox carteri f. nagariensis]|eukprot:XP_002947247.1 hypothetical protein VOLCADRAFT_87411 [Volvox carteri f. nagariensis]